MNQLKATVLIQALAISSIFIFAEATKKEEEPAKIQIPRFKPKKEVYIYRKEDNKKTNYLEKEDSLNLINS